ncbi:MAG: hypothetical protein KKC75_02600 [Nanoarchaeota archaeon]|nr:hypothetical protein [Nanoarchaeota archaeon]MBU1005416.1 hypothetical protein [Nanoarchaeota archaeon]MBU1945849.1 hypothetical protein [Nanoarchaeota archaeon]
MTQNRNKLINLLVGNLSNAIVHEVLAKAIDDEIIRNRYSKELKVSMGISKRYREKINPVNSPLPEKDAEYIKDKIAKRVKAELELRKSKGYENIDFEIVDPSVDTALESIKIK